MNVEFVEYRCSQCKGHFIEPIHPGKIEIDTIKRLAEQGALACEPCLTRAEEARPPNGEAAVERLD